jgi:hypothetical protein
MHSWIIRNRLRLGIVYGIRPDKIGQIEAAEVQAMSERAAALAPGKVLKTNDDVLLGPWGRRRA